MNKHTATPWKVCRTSAPYLIVGNIKDIYSTWVVNDVASEANAAYIVKAVNAHEALVEALKAVLSTVIVNGDLTTSYAIDRNVKIQIREALKLAGEE